MQVLMMGGRNGFLQLTMELVGNGHQGRIEDRYEYHVPVGSDDNLSRESSMKRLRRIVAGVAALAVAATALTACVYENERRAYQYDVVVVGADPGGIAAGIQAARLGERVAILEETDWVGGQITAAGVGTMDEGSTIVRSNGIYGDFAKRAIAYYQQRHKSVDTCYYGGNSLCIEPRVGQLILRQMLGDEGHNLDLYTGRHVSSVDKRGGDITGVVANGQTFNSKVIIDSEPYGDVLAMAGVPFRLGNTTSDAPNVDGSACVQAMTYSPVIKEYPNGVPGNLVLKAPPPGYNSVLAKHFAAFLTQNGYGLVVQDGHLLPHRSPMSFAAYAAYRGLPDLSNPQDYTALQHGGQDITRTSLDLGNDYPVSGDLTTQYVSDRSFRMHSNAEAMLLSLQLLYYIQHDLGLKNWSIANDEGYNTTYNTARRYSELHGYEPFEDLMPQAPYVREGRRLIGVETLTGQQLQYSWKDPKHVPTYADSIAVGYYPMDLHGCRGPRSLESVFDAPDYIKSTYAGGAFEVPMGVLIPTTINGLLATDNNISVSREANGATREQPIAMAIGQAAGVLAALAIQHHEQPRSVAASQVRSVLSGEHVMTDVRS